MDCVAEAFRVFDLNGDGYLDKAEIAKIIGNLGTGTFRAPDPDFVDALIKEADINGDGKIRCMPRGRSRVHSESHRTLPTPLPRSTLSRALAPHFAALRRWRACWQHLRRRDEDATRCTVQCSNARIAKARK